MLLMKQYRPLIPHSSLTRRELGWALLLIALSVTLFLGPALFTGRYLSPADLLFDYFPWRAQPPPGWTHPANNILSDSVFLYKPWLDYSAALLHRRAPALECRYLPRRAPARQPARRPALSGQLALPDT